MKAMQTFGTYMRSLRDAKNLSRMQVHDQALRDYGVQISDDTIRLLEDEGRAGISALRLGCLVKIYQASFDEVFERMFRALRDDPGGLVPTEPPENMPPSGDRPRPPRARRSDNGSRRRSS